MKHDLSLKTIYEKFLLPLVKILTRTHSEDYYDSDVSIKAVEQLFNIKHRYIKSFKLHRNIESMPGEYYITDGYSSPAKPRKKFKRGHLMLLVLDKRFPDDIKVEIFKGWGIKDSCQYRLTKQELASILPYITPLERHKEKAKKQKRVSRARLKKKKKKT